MASRRQFGNGRYVGQVRCNLSALLDSGSRLSERERERNGEGERGGDEGGGLERGEGRGQRDEEGRKREGGERERVSRAQGRLER